jgi:putative transcriptional regulator
LENNLRRIRRGNEETQEQLASVIGVSRQTIIDIEKGHTKRPADEVMIKIADHYKMPVNDIFFTPLVKQVTQDIAQDSIQPPKPAA